MVCDELLGFLKIVSSFTPMIWWWNFGARLEGRVNKQKQMASRLGGTGFLSSFGWEIWMLTSVRLNRWFRTSSPTWVEDIRFGNAYSHGIYWIHMKGIIWILVIHKYSKWFCNPLFRVPPSQNDHPTFQVVNHSCIWPRATYNPQLLPAWVGTTIRKVDLS